MDIIVADSYRKAELLLNDGKSRDAPNFLRQPFYNFAKKNHSNYSGGGDWNQDGIQDYVFMPYGGGEYHMIPGERVNGFGVKFNAMFPGWVGIGIGIKGIRAQNCAFAWDFSGTAKARNVTEYVGVGDQSTDEFLTMSIFEMDNTTRESRRIQYLTTSAASDPTLTIGDLNKDGLMDVLYSGGHQRAETQETKIYVMYGQ